MVLRLDNFDELLNFLVLALQRLLLVGESLLVFCHFLFKSLLKCSHNSVEHDIAILLDLEGCLELLSLLVQILVILLQLSKRLATIPLLLLTQSHL